MYIEEWSEELECQASEVHTAIVKLINDAYKKNEEIKDKLKDLSIASTKDPDEAKIIEKLYKLNEEMEDILTEKI